MKVLTVRQPWAQLIIHGGKDIENRDWSTSVRGCVAIHSSEKMERRELESACDFMASWIPKFSARVFSEEARAYPLGCIIGTVEVVDCVRRSDSPWFMGEYGFVLRNPIALPQPIRVRGQPGWWEYPLETALTGGPA